MLETLLSFTISLLIGLLIGIERERSHPEGSQFIGVRTFTIISILGTLVATLNQAILTLTTSSFLFGILLLNYFRSTAKDKKHATIDILTEITASIIFCLGYMVPGSPLVAITLSAIIVLVLLERQRLHTLARKKFKPHEIETAIILVIFTLGILPILPDRTIDPWHFFNPRVFGLLLATIAAIQFGSYVAIQLFGERLGIPFTGLLGGLISSTAFFTQLPDILVKHPQFWLATLSSCLLATIAMAVDVILIIFVASPTLLAYIIWPIISMIGSGIIFILILLHYQKTPSQELLLHSRPLNLLSILRSSIFIGFMLILIAIAKRFISMKGILLISFLGGLVEIHGISLATALLYFENQLIINDARLVLYIAIFASFISKITLLWALTPPRFAFQASLLLVGMLFSGGIVYWMEL